jgi:toxin ParE1/3/4
VTARVLLTRAALLDLDELHLQVTRRQGAGEADRLVARIEARCAALDELPLRGNIVPELLDLGIRHYRELHERPLRIIYHVDADRLLIDAVLDARRDIRSLLERRLLR